MSGLVLTMTVGESCCGVCRALATAFVILATAVAETFVQTLVDFVAFLTPPDFTVSDGAVFEAELAVE